MGNHLLRRCLPQYRVALDADSSNTSFCFSYPSLPCDPPRQTTTAPPYRIQLLGTACSSCDTSVQFKLTFFEAQTLLRICAGGIIPVPYRASGGGETPQRVRQFTPAVPFQSSTSTSFQAFWVSWI